MTILIHRRRFHAGHCYYEAVVVVVVVVAVDVVAVSLDGFGIKKGKFSAVPLVLNRRHADDGDAAAKAAAAAADDDCS